MYRASGFPVFRPRELPHEKIGVVLVLVAVACSRSAQIRRPALPHPYRWSGTVGRPWPLWRARSFGRWCATVKSSFDFDVAGRGGTCVAPAISHFRSFRLVSIALLTVRLWRSLAVGLQLVGVQETVSVRDCLTPGWPSAGRGYDPGDLPDQSSNQVGQTVSGYAAGTHVHGRSSMPA